MVDWITTKIPSTAKGLPVTTLSLRTAVRNAAAVFSGCYGAVTRRAEQAGCSRQTVYEHAHQVEQRLQPPLPPSSAPEISSPAPAVALDEPTRRRLAVTAFAIFVFWRILTKAGLSGPLSLLILVPAIGWIIVVCILAFSEWRVVPAPQPYPGIQPYPPPPPPQL